MIEIKALKGVTSTGRESQVLSQLIAMDYNGDGFVEASEWETTFGRRPACCQTPNSR